MNELVDFLHARISEDEADARTRVETFGPHLQNTRALAECESKRRIVDSDPGPSYEDGDEEYMSGKDRQYEETLRLLALPYADHPAYRSEWAP